MWIVDDRARHVVGALCVATLIQLPLAGAADAAPNSPDGLGRIPATASSAQRADVAPPLVRRWAAQVVRDRLKILPSKADVVATVVDATAVATVAARFVRGPLVYGGEAVNTNGNSWRAVFELPAADTTGIYEVWIDAKDTRGNAAATMVGTLRFP